jgi:hypothetical protein
MSFRTGDRARAHKIAGKRRVRRSALRLLRRVSTSAPVQHEVAVPPPAAPKA